MAANGVAFSPEAYQNAFISDRPRAAVNSVSGRLKRSELIATSLANYFAERAAIELDYTRSLSKLAKKQLVPESYGLNGNPTASAWAAVQSRLEDELEAMVSLHDGFSTKLEEQVVRNLREKSREGDGVLRQNENNIHHLVKDYDDAESRMSKARSKKNDSSRVQQSQYELSEAHGAWMSQAPAYFSASQAVDRARLEAIKENIAKYETLCNDLGRDKMELAERGLVSVFGWEVDEDMNLFLASEGNRRAPVAGEASLSSSRNSQLPPPPVDEPAYAAPPIEQNNRQVAPALAPDSFLGTPERERAPSIHSQQSRTGKSGGLFSSLTKKLKPGMSRNRSSSQSNSYGNLNNPSSASPARQTAQDYRPPADDESENLDTRAMSSDSNDYPSSQSSKRSSFLPGMMRRKNSVSKNPPPRQNSTQGRVGGMLSPPTEESRMSPELETPTSTAQSTNPFDRPTSMFVNGSQADQSQQYGRQGAVDAEGFSVPPANHDRSPWEGSTGGASLMDDDDDMPPASASSLPKLNMDIAQPSSPVSTERPEDSQAAMLSVQSALQSKSPTSNLNRRQTRGRRDVRASTIRTPSNDDMPLAQVVSQQQQYNGPPAQSPGAMAQSPDSLYTTPQGTASSGFSHISPPGSAIHPGRSVSIMSASSSQISPSTQANGLLSDPTGSGLRGVITESVNVLSKLGAAPRVMITGELSLLLKGTSTDSLRIRVNQFSALEKSAPNTQFLQATDAPGEYMVNASSLSSVSAGGSATVVLRYQVAVPEPLAENYVPVKVSPQWKTEATQTSLLVTYSANPACHFINASSSPFESESEAATLRELTFVIPVSSDGVTNVQSKPLALYSSEKKRLLWKLDDLEMDSSAPQKALARFAVADQTTPQPVAVKWKVTGKLISGINLEVVDGPTQVEETACLVQAGKYLVSN